VSINFPNTPTTGQLYPSPPVAGVPVYKWDGAKWLIQVAATAVAMRNYVINGAMMVSQENGATVGTTSVYYPVDQFAVYNSSTAAASIAQVASLTPSGSPNRLRFTVTTADASVTATKYVEIVTVIEGYRVADLKFGTAGARQIVLQFGVRAPAGVYSVAFTNYNLTPARTYVGEYTIAAGEANIDVIKSVTLTADVTGNWNTINSGGIQINFALMVGANYAAVPGSWGAGGSSGTVGSVNQFNFMGTAGNVFELFDVGLYQGSVAPAFQVPPYDQELQTCRRYFQVTGACAGTWYSTTGIEVFIAFQPEMRASPSAILRNGTNGANVPGVGNYNITSINGIFNADQRGMGLSCVSGPISSAVPTGGAIVSGAVAMNARM
jgi:hypothetical protein